MTVKYIKPYQIRQVFAEGKAWPSTDYKFIEQPTNYEQYQQFAMCCGNYQCYTKESFAEDKCVGIETFITDEEYSFTFSEGIVYYTIPLEGKDVLHVKLQIDAVVLSKFKDNDSWIEERGCFLHKHARNSQRAAGPDSGVPPIMKQVEAGPYRDLYFQGNHSVNPAHNLLDPNLGWYFSIIKTEVVKYLMPYINENLEIIHQSQPFTNSNYPEFPNRLIFFIFKRKQHA